jgi:hypothetical protein
VLAVMEKKSTRDESVALSTVIFPQLGTENIFILCPSVILFITIYKAFSKKFVH